MKRHLFVIGGLILLAFSVLFSLNATMEKPNKYKNGFNRKFLKNYLLRTVILKYEDDIYCICGFKSDTVFFSHKTPGKISYIYGDGKALKQVQLALPHIDGLVPVFYTTVDYPSIYILGGNARKIIQGNLLTNQYEIKNIDIGAFNNGVAINTNSFIVRAVDTSTLNESFYKINLSKDIIEMDIDLSERLKDAGFIHDGMLNYDRVTHKLAYVDFYSNKVTCFDTSLKLIVKSKTIDTTSISSSKPVKKDNSISNSRPPITINQLNTADNGVLYVLSRLIADNEKTDSFEENTVVDEYEELTGNYIGSFYLSGIRSDKLKQFKICSGYCVILYDKQIIKYQLKLGHPISSIL